MSDYRDMLLRLNHARLATNAIKATIIDKVIKEKSRKRKNKAVIKNYILYNPKKDSKKKSENISDVFHKIIAYKPDINQTDTKQNKGLNNKKRTYKQLYSIGKKFIKSYNRKCRFKSQQMVLINKVLRMLCSKHGSQLQNGDFEPIIPILLQGMPGTGKTTALVFMIAMACHMKLGYTARTAFTGMAAGLLNGFLLLSTMKITKDSQTFRPLNDHQLKNLRDLICSDSLVMLILDEVSMVRPNWIAKLERRLRELTNVNLPFGGILVILSGDFAQIGPVTGYGIPSIVIEHTKYLAKQNNKFEPEKLPLDVEGSAIIMKSTTIVLDEIVRSITDKKHTEFEKILCKGEQITMDDLRMYKVLTPEDIKNDIEWLFAPVIVTTNRERVNIIHEKAIAYAKYYNVPIIRWKCHLVDTDSLRNVPFQFDSKLGSDPCFWQYFLPNVDAYLTATINTALKLANGTRVKLISLYYNDEKEMKSLQKKIELSKPGQFITLDKPPDAVNVQPIDKICMQDCETFGIYKNKKSVIPIIRGVKTPDSKDYIVVTADNHPLQVTTRDLFCYALMFAMTVEKAQGCTLEKIIIAISENAHKQLWRYAKFLVAMSRTTTGDGIRFLMHDIPGVGDKFFAAFYHITKLKPRKEVMAFLAGFENGKTWNKSKALSKYKEITPLTHNKIIDARKQIQASLKQIRKKSEEKKKSKEQGKKRKQLPK